MRDYGWLYKILLLILDSDMCSSFTNNNISLDLKKYFLSFFSEF